MRKKPGYTRGNAPDAAEIDPANFIRDARKALGLSLMDAAARVGVSHQTWQQWEKKGNLQVSQLPQVAAALGVAPADLVPGKSELTAEERRVLMGFRLAGAREKQTILRVIADLSEPLPEAFEVRRPSSPGKSGRGKS